MPNDLGSHRRWNRKSRHLIKLLSKTRVKSVRLKIIEELQHEIERAKQSRLGQAAKRGAIGASGWGKRVVAKGEDYAKRPARRNHTRASVGAYARQQAVEREKNRPARDAAKLKRQEARTTRQQQRATRRQQRAAQGTGPVARIKAARAGRRGQMANGGNGTITRVSSPRAPRKPAAITARKPAATTARKPVTQSRPAPDARAARAAKPASRTPALPSETIRPTRSTRASRAPRSSGSASKTG